MTTPLRLSRACARTFTLLALLGACGGKDGAPGAESAAATTPASGSAGQSADAQLKDIGAYRLSMAKVDRYMAAQRNIMNKAASLTPAEQAAMRARSEANGNADASLDEMVRRIESEPLMMSAIREADLSPREFTMITMSMLQSAMAAGVAKMRPKDNQDSLIRAMQASPENVKFIIENQAELDRKQKELQAEAERLKGKLGGSGD